MYIKRYTVAAFILIALVGVFVYTYITQETTTINFFGIPLPSLSIALWVTVPLVILYFASVLHMLFYTFLGSLSLRKYEKDYDKILDAIVNAYLGKDVKAQNFKTDRYTLLGTLLENTALFPKGDLVGITNNEKIDTVLKTIEDIKKGEVVDLKQYELAMENELVVQNERNRYKKGELTAEALLANSPKYTQDLKQEVYADFVEIASLANIEKYKALMSKDALFTIILRVNAENFTLDLESEALVSFVKRLEFSTDDYMELAHIVSNSSINPDQRMKFFELLSESNEDATPAYLYTLFDLEVLEPADEILQSSQSGEYQKFKAYRALKECNKKFSIELFV